jgi:Raf kinase inhibitor-like YbhB/YbcL family protein
MELLNRISRIAGRALRPVRAGMNRLASEQLKDRADARMHVESPSFPSGGTIPAKHSDSEGENVSPGLRWSSVPEGTRELVLLCEDPDIPMRSPFVHWVLYGIPGDAREIPEGVGREESPIGALQGKNSLGRRGYMGPHPPPGHGKHHYCFQLFALDGPIDLTPGATRDEVVHAMAGQVIGMGRVIGVYAR